MEENKNTNMERCIQLRKQIEHGKKEWVEENRCETETLNNKHNAFNVHKKYKTLLGITEKTQMITRNT